MSNKLREVFTVELTEDQKEMLQKAEDEFLAKDYDALTRELSKMKQRIFEYSKLSSYWFDLFEFESLISYKEKIEARIKEIEAAPATRANVHIFGKQIKELLSLSEEQIQKCKDAVEPYIKSL